MFIDWSVNSIQLLTGFEDNSSLFDLSTDLLPSACGFPQQINSRVKQNYWCLRSQSITVLLYTFIFSKKNYIHSFHSHFNILVRQVWESCSLTSWHCDINIKWLIEPMKIRPSINSSIVGNRSINCWLFNRTVLQLPVIGILLLTVKMLCIYCIAFNIGEKMMVYNNFTQSVVKQTVISCIYWPLNRSIKQIYTKIANTRWNSKNLQIR